MNRVLVFTIIFVVAHNAYVCFWQRINEYQCSTCFSKRYITKSYTDIFDFRIPVLPQVQRIENSHTYNDYKGNFGVNHRHQWVFRQGTYRGSVGGCSLGGKLRRSFFAEEYEKNIELRNFIKQKIKNNELETQLVCMILTTSDFSLEIEDIRLSNKGYALYDEFEKQCKK